MSKKQKQMLYLASVCAVLLLAVICATVSRSCRVASTWAAVAVSCGYLMWLLYFLSFRTRLDKLSKDEKEMLAQAKSPLRYYMKYRLSYDWLKHLGIVMGSVLLWLAVISAVTNYKPHERVTVFLSAYEVVQGEQLEKIHTAAEQNGIGQLSLNCYDFESDKFPTVLAVKGIYGSDLLILDHQGMELYLNGGNALELTPQVLDALGAGSDVRLEQVNGHSRAVLIYDADDPAYNQQFDLSFLRLSADGAMPTTDHYLIINGKSIHALPFAPGKTDAVIDLCREIF